jgi:RNA polymerase sigma factor (sigma-70 family)
MDHDGQPVTRHRDPVEAARREGDAAFQEWRRVTEPVARRVAQTVFGGNVTRNGHDPQEAVDTAYAQFYAKRFDESLPTEERRALLLKIVQRRALDLVRRRERTVSYPDHDHESRLGENQGGFEEVEERDEARRAVGQLEDVLERLTPKQREAFTLRVNHGQTTSEIAEALGVSERRVNQLLNEAAQRLGRRLRARDRDREDHGSPGNTGTDKEKERGN